MSPDLKGRGAFIERFQADDQVVKRLDIYAHLLRKWQRSINLIGPTTLASLWTRHFWDSAQLAPLAGGRTNWLDFGSGAGFPGLVVAILLAEKDDAFVQLVESDQRKCAFLREVSRETGIKTKIHNCRIEAVNVAGKEAIEVVSARALASMKNLYGYAQEYIDLGAIGLFPKGQDVAVELTEASIPSNISVELAQSETDVLGRIVILKRMDLGLSKAAG